MTKESKTQKIENNGSRNSIVQIGENFQGEILLEYYDKLKKLSDSEVLGYVSPEFLNHHAEQTVVLDYYKWHENTEDMYKGTDGRLMSFSSNENELWYDSNKYENYEAKLYNSIGIKGVEANRLWVIPNSLINKTESRNFIKTLLRHYKLGIKPRIITLAHLTEAKKIAGIKDVDTMAIFHGKYAYYCFKPELNSRQYMVRSNDLNQIINIEKAYNYISQKDSIDFEGFLKHFNITISKELDDEVERECEIIIAKSKLDSNQGNSSS